MTPSTAILANPCFCWTLWTVYIFRVNSRCARFLWSNIDHFSLEKKPKQWLVLQVINFLHVISGNSRFKLYFTYKMLHFNVPLVLKCIYRNKCSSAWSCLGPLGPIITQICFTCHGLSRMKRGAGCFVLCFSINPAYFGNRHFRHFKKKPGTQGTAGWYYGEGKWGTTIISICK